MAHDPDDAPVLTKKELAALKDLFQRSDGGELYALSGELQAYRRRSLERKGLVVVQEEDGEVWLRLTEAGRVAIDWHILYNSGEYYLEMGYRERRNNNMAMSDVQYELMCHLEEEWDAGNAGFVDVQVWHGLTVKALEKKGWITTSNGNRQARITDAGLGAIAAEHGERPDIPLPANSQRPNGVGAKVKPFTPPTPSVAGATSPPQAGENLAAVNGGCEDCECVPKRVLGLLSARNPKVKELIEALELADGIIEELGL